MKLELIFHEIKKNRNNYLSGLWGTSLAYFLAKFFKEQESNCIIITENIRQAGDFYSDLTFFHNEKDIILLPDFNLYPNEELSYKRDIIQQLESYYSTLDKKKYIFITTIKNIYLKNYFHELLPANSLDLSINSQIDYNQFEQTLLEIGYERTNKVILKGAYSIRGDIIDIFPVNADKPVRIELFDETIEDIRSFNIETQKSSGQVNQIRIYPAEAIILKPEIIDHFEKTIAAKIKNSSADNPEDIWDKPLIDQKDIFYLIDKVKNKEFSSDIYNFLPYFYTNYSSMINLFPDNTYIFIPSQEILTQTYTTINTEFKELYKKQLNINKIFPAPEEFLIPFRNIEKILSPYHLTFYSMLPFNMENEIQFYIKGIPDFSGDITRFFNYYKNKISDNYYIHFVSEYTEQIENFKKLLAGEKISIKNISYHQGMMRQGFEIDKYNEIYIQDFEFYGRIKSTYSKSYKAKILTQEVESIYDLEEGDYIVHLENGIGKYHGIKKINTKGQIKDFFNIEYANKMFMLLPLDKINMIHKYIGDDDNLPPLNKLGSNEFKRSKDKVKRSLIKITKDLIRIYAIREKINGYKFSIDSEYQEEMENSFKYIETPDQLKALNEIKEEMESEKPMDRLLCGDVGYGKTEVAIRIAFKANMEGKQVAILVPTTILAQQHYTTFKNRLKAYPIRIEMLSRFIIAREQKKIIKEANEGKVDILIGTHRIISPDVKFKDLGLVIIDEEQRFGVAHKEKLKMIRSIVDVLTMSATPIPRTLYMSLSGIRDISLIETPPEGRVPIETKIEKFSPEIIRKTILTEINRGGQAFFVHNRIKSIYAMAEYLQKIVPEAKFLVAHGRMDNDELEYAMLDFIEKNCDVLISTTIIESGIDMPNVNTIIINRADTFGLAQLYQLRGRVGRGLHRGHAVLLYPGNKAITETAQKRLLTIYEYSELGSGYKIALRDMEIRGAGNIFGPQQHGNIVAVGLELYSRILQNAVKTIKGEMPEREFDPNLDFEYNAYIPDSYINNNKNKIEIYKKLNQCHDFDALNLFIQEISDRFGKDIPQETKDLFMLQEIKIICRKPGILSIRIKETRKYEYIFILQFETMNPKIAKKMNSLVDFSNIHKYYAFLNIEIEDFLIKLKKKLLLLL